MWMELEDVKYHCIALHYYLLRTYNVAARISDVFLHPWYSRSHDPSSVYHPCVTASRRI